MTGLGNYGEATLALVQGVLDRGVERAALLMRHSAREFNREIHDLLNPLTDEGREYCLQLGAALPEGLHLRGYASPPERCVETAQLVVDAHAADGGSFTRTRVVESLGVFYALDQIKMWKGLHDAGGLEPYTREWTHGRVPVDAMIPAPQAASLVASATLHRLRTATARHHLDVCVTHDMTVLLVRDRLLEQPVEDHEVRFLDGLVLFEQDGGVWLQSQHGPAREISSLLD
jgi:broad specificity phosphatase PhoE